VANRPTTSKAPGTTFITQATPFSTQLAHKPPVPLPPNIGSTLTPAAEAAAAAAAAATAMISPAVQALIRKLLTARRKSPAASGDEEPTFVVTSEDLSKWLAEAVTQVGDGA